MNTYHVPVMVQEILDGLRVTPGMRVIDATVGGGGHTVAMLKKGAVLLGIDADRDAIRYAAERIRKDCPDKEERKDWSLVQGNFRSIDELAKGSDFGHADGILFDLGVSSYQLDTPSKGFTYKDGTGNIDLRFDQSQGQSACEYIQASTEEDLYEVLARYGEEERSGAIAHALIRTRSLRKNITTSDIVASVVSVVGQSKETPAILSRVFQALRIYVNDELASLTQAIEKAQDVLKPGGRIAVVSYHSLEDRIVKRNFIRYGWIHITKKPILPDEREITINRRARSAKLRIAQKI